MIDIGFERFEEDFYADYNMMYIKPSNDSNDNVDRYLQITTKISAEQREKFLARKKPMVLASYERYCQKCHDSNN